MNETQKALKREYARQYKKTHKDQVNEYQRQYAKAHPEKRKEWNHNYWVKKIKAETTEETK